MSSSLPNNKLLNYGLWLEYATLVWNIFECSFVLLAGITSGSVALIGFGIDSVIEIFASVVVIWQLKSINKEKEKFAEKIIGVAFILLAIYILLQSLASLINQSHPKNSPLGMLSLGLTVIAMFSLARGKAKVGEQLDNPVLLRESKVTLIDASLAASVLLGVVLNGLFGLWWADSLAGLVIVYYGFKEGVNALRS